MSHIDKDKQHRENDLTLRKALNSDAIALATIVGEGGLANFQIIQSINDFPAAIASVITLPAGSGIYQINGTVAMGDVQLVVESGAFLHGVTSARDGLAWTSGSGPHIVFDGVGSTHDIRNLFLIGHSGEDIFGTANIPATVLMRALLTITGSVGLFNLSAVFFATECQFSGGANPLRFGTSVARSLVFRLSNVVPQAGDTGPCMDLETSVWDLITIDDVQFSPDAVGDAVKALSGNANLTASTGRGEVESCRFNGDGGALTGGVTVDDLQWLFIGNAGLSNSLSAGEWPLAGNTTTTIANGTFQPVLGTFTSGLLHRFTLSAAGLQTYIGLNPRPFEIKIALLAEMASGASKSVSFQMYHTPLATGTPVGVGDPFTLDIDNKPTLVELHSAIEVVTGDQLQVRLRNNDDGIGVTVLDMSGLTTGIPTGV